MTSSDSANLRSALIDAAAQLIATEGAPALTLRRVADEVGTSTMAIYTHFGGMPELRRAVRREGFSRLAAQLADVGETADPVADLGMLGRAYYENAIGNPHLYRVAFMEQPLDVADAEIGSEAFDSLVAGVQRCIASDRFDVADAGHLAREFWALGHGVITLQLAALMTAEEALRCLDGGVLKLFRAYGDDPDAAYRSLERARRRAGVPADQAVA
jgi:AcrR family transcriptional regulator